MYKNKILIILGALMVILGTLFYTWHHDKPTLQSDGSEWPDHFLLEALAKEQKSEYYITGGPYNSSETGTMVSYFNASGTYKSDIQLTCQGHSNYVGDTTIKAHVIQIDNNAFTKIEDIRSVGTGDAAINARLKRVYSVLSGKWVQNKSEDAIYSGYRTSGVLFGKLGAYSKTIDPEQIMSAYDQADVYSVLSKKDMIFNDKPAIEYSLVIGRDNYSDFIDSVAPNFSYKPDVLKMLFPDDQNQNVSLIISKDGERVLATTYETLNPCKSTMAIVDPTIILPEGDYIKIRTTSDHSKLAKDIQKPVNTISAVDFDEALSEALQTTE